MTRPTIDHLDTARMRREAERLRAEMIRGFVSRLGSRIRGRR